jgi:hypothetical protein
MNSNEDPIDDELARLGTETEGVVPRADFALRVMARVDGAARADWSFELLHRARVGMAIAAMAAAACVAIAWHASNSADQEEAVAYGIAEAFE